MKPTPPTPDPSDLKGERANSGVECPGAAGGAVVDPEHPWPGLAPFTEDQSQFFYGRDAEIRTLVRQLERKALTVLFGQSGLGKSSLLMAGIFPRLRAANFCPIYLRLDHGEGTPPPGEQVKAMVAEATARVGQWTKPRQPLPGESLWEFFHRRDDRLVDPSGRAIVPVLVFDQFEELFTLGSAGGAQRDRAVAFMSELAELVENRPSEALVARLEQSADEMDAFDFNRTDYRVCIALREDYLPHLEGLKTIMPALMENRMRLTHLTGVQALDAVLKPGGALVTPEVARAIVEFVSGARGGSAERLAEVTVEPPLLSVICRELNERRRTRGQATITADLVSGNRREILHDFYNRSVADLPLPMRAFVEDRLLTKSGFRENLAVETALEIPGVTRPLIDTLVSRRLLRLEEHLGVLRVELSHDVLADVIRASRDERQSREALKAEERRRCEAEAALARAEMERAAARRSLWRTRLMLAACAVLALAAALAFWEATKARARAERLAEIADRSRANAVAAQAATELARKQAVTNEKRAQTEAARSAQVAQFMKDMLKGVGPRVALGRDTKLLRDILDTTATRLGTELAAQPEVAAEMRDTLSDVYTELGDQNRAAAILGEALEQRRKLLGSEHPAVVATLTKLGRTLARVGNLAEAEARLREALALAQKAADGSDTEVMTTLAAVLATEDKSVEALAIYREVLALEKHRWGAVHARTATALEKLGSELGHQYQWAEAEASLREAVALRRKLGEGDGEKLAKALSTLGGFLRRTLKNSAAEEALREALAIHRKRLGDKHPDLPVPLEALANVLEYLGKWVEAEQLYREAGAMRREFLGNEHPDVATSLRNISQCLLRQGERVQAEAMLVEALGIYRKLGLDRDISVTLGEIAAMLPRSRANEAEKLRREKLEIVRRVYGPAHPTTIAALASLRASLQSQDKSTDAKEVEQEIQALREQLPRDPAGEHLRARTSRGFVLQQQRKFAEAEAAYREELAQLREKEGPETEIVALTLEYLGRLLWTGLRKLPEAEVTIREALAIRRKVMTNTDREGSMGTTLNNLGQVLFAQCKLEEAEAAQRESVALLQRMPASYTPITLEQLVATLRLQGKYAAIEKLQRDALDSSRQRQGADSKETADNHCLLAYALLETRKFAEAEASARECLALRTKLAPDDWKVGEARSVMGRALGNQAKYAEAEAELSAAFTILTERRPRTVSAAYYACLRTTAEQLADICEATRQPAKAAEWLLRAAEIDLRENERIAADTELADLLKQTNEIKQQGDLGKLEIVQRQILGRVGVLSGGVGKPSSFFSLSLADTLAKAGRLNEAELLIRRSIDQRERFFRVGSWQISEARGMLGANLMAQRRYAEAEPILLAAHAELHRLESTIPAASKQRLAETAQSLAKLYAATNQPEKAAQWQRRAEGVPETSPE